MALPPEDFTAISNLYALYNHLADGDDPEAYAQLYARNGVLVSGGKILGEGRAAILGFRRGIMSSRGQTVRRHWITNLTLDPTDDGRVRGRCYFLVMRLVPGADVDITHVGIYTDLLEREDDEWRFSRRELQFDHRVVAT